MRAVFMEVDEKSFEEEVVNSPLPVVVDIWSPKCSPCLDLLPQVEVLANEYEGMVKFCKLNAADNRSFCKSMKVMAVPTILFYNNGKVVDKLTGDRATRESIQASMKSLV